MLRRKYCFVAIITVTVKVAETYSTVMTFSSTSSICNRAEECYVNGVLSKVCDRTLRKCNRCLAKQESDTFLSSVKNWVEYGCYNVNEDGECPSGTIKCPTTMKTTRDDEEQTSSSDIGTLDEEGSKLTSTSAISKKSSLSTTSDLSDLTTESSFTMKQRPPSVSSTLDDTNSKFTTRETMKPTTLLSPSHDDTNDSLATLKTTKSTTLFSPDDTSGSPPTLEPTKKTKTKKTTKDDIKSPVTSPSSVEETLEDGYSDSYSSSRESSAVSLYEEPYSTFYSPVSDSEADQEGKPHETGVSSVETPTAPTTPTAAHSTIKDKALSKNEKSTSTAPATSNSDDSHVGLIIGVIGGAAAVVAFAGFVAWKKKQDDEDFDDDDAAFSPKKTTTSRDAASLPSASSATTAYLAQPNCYENNNYEQQYNNKYGNNYGDNYGNNYGNNGHSNNYMANHYATGGKPGDVVPASYGSPYSIDIDSDNLSRRTDSILGGTGVMSSTTSSMQTPFEFTGGPSPSNSDMNQDIWGNEMDTFHQKRTASSASVEF